MATWPTAYVKLGWKETGLERKPVVVRSEMERGIAKQRRIAADAVVTVPVTAYFDSQANATAWENWVDTQIGSGTDWFDIAHPMTGATISARIVGGDIGTLQPSVVTWARTMRKFKIEYVKALL